VPSHADQVGSYMMRNISSTFPGTPTAILKNQNTARVAAAKVGIGNYFAFYNGRRPHTALDRDTPDNVYFESQPLAVAA